MVGERSSDRMPVFGLIGIGVGIGGLVVGLALAVASSASGGSGWEEIARPPAEWPVYMKCLGIGLSSIVVTKVLMVPFRALAEERDPRSSSVRSRDLMIVAVGGGAAIALAWTSPWGVIAAALVVVVFMVDIGAVARQGAEPPHDEGHTGLRDEGTAEQRVHLPTPEPESCDHTTE